LDETKDLFMLLTKRLPTSAAFALQVSMLLFFLAGSSAPTPLYAVYQAEWGFSPITITVVFGIYALAVLVALLVFGSLSDHIGRRPVLLVALVLQAATMIVFATAGGVPELIVARVVQGLSTGAAVGALGAGLLDLNRARGTVFNGVGAMAGTATGALGSALLVQYLPDPTRLVYVLLFAVFVAQFVGVLFMRESATAKAGALSSLRVTIGVPPVVRGPLLVAAPAVVAVWSLAGFYGSLGPSLVKQVAGSHSLVLGGLALFVLAGFGSATVLVVRAGVPRIVMTFGALALIVGVGVTLVAVTVSSTILFFVGTAIAGIGFGAGFQGALRTVVPLAEAHERAGVLSTLYVLSYLGLGVPAVIAGVLVVHAGGLLTTAREYGGAVMLLAALALLGLGLAWRAERETVALVADNRATVDANPPFVPAPRDGASAVRIVELSETLVAANDR
jgi:MFS family permease